MAHLKALSIKAIMTIVALSLVLSLGFGVSFTNVLILTVVLGAVSYLMGDLYIFPKTSNTMATLSDALVTFLVVWLLGMALTSLGIGTMAGAALISTIVMAIGEYLFHFYVAKKNLGVHNLSTNH